MLLALPPELRLIIYNFCFPPAQTPVQIVPYRASLPACRLNLPLPLYLVCKQIHSELPPLPEKLRRLDLTYIIRGPVLGGGQRPEYGSRHDDDHERFVTIMRFAERVRLVGPPPVHSSGRSIQSPYRVLRPGAECALRILEVQPRRWPLSALVATMLHQLGPLTTHPDVAARLEVRLIRDPDDLIQSDEEVKDILRKYKEFKDRGGEGPIRVHLDSLDRPVQAVESRTLDEMEVWLTKFQNVTGSAVMHRAQPKGPLKY
ncbi:hypothetical protein B0H11DRAFT_936348 [Mycena galericulata]|nr:hypothetical protein B0H11DRAFT_936348 [Mycena galericulata]